MKNRKNDIWKGTEDLTNNPDLLKDSLNEFKEELPLVEKLAKEEGLLKAQTGRRDFLKYLGFGIGAATVAAGCDIPVKKAIPYVIQPDEIVPGVAVYYASTFVKGGDYCSVIVKTREGRPIKIEGNSLSNVTKGGTNARAQAAVLDLYDTGRIQGPGSIADGAVTKMSWAEIDKAVKAKLNAGSRVRMVTRTNMSPTMKAVFADFTAKYPNTKVITYDPVSSSAILQANEKNFGQKVIPNYHFDKAKVIVSFNADFLGTWISPIEYSADYIKNRKIKDVNNPKMSRHIQVESYMSVTGSNADNRILVKPSELGAAIANLYNAVAAKTGGATVSAPKVNDKAATALKKAAAELVAAKGHALVVSGSNNLGEQILVNGINVMLGNYGSTITFDNASLQRQGIDGEIQGLLAEMKSGGVDALFFMGDANPAFDLPNAGDFAAAMSKVGLKVSFSGLMNETLAACNYVAPDHHFLESWGDAEPKKGMFSLIQPTIAPLFDTRQAGETLLRWAGSEKLAANSDQPFMEYLKAYWKSNLFPEQGRFGTFQAFWDSTLHDGVFELKNTLETTEFTGDMAAAAAMINKPGSGEMEIQLYETVNMGGGEYATNPWLQELPDPVNRTTWGNYLAIPVTWDGGNEFGSLHGLNPHEYYGKADRVDVSANSKTERLTCARMFGLMEGTVATALGYGRKTVGAAGKNIGTDAFGWLSIDKNGNTQYYATDASVSEKVEDEKTFPNVQYHHTMGVKGIDPATNEEINVDEKTIATLGAGYQGSLTKRSVIRQSNLKEIKELVEQIKEEHEEAEHLNSKTLYPYEEYKEDLYNQGHHWGMHIDMNACTGCGACVVSCMAENNIPVVGREEVHRHHEMTWLRIDRYYYGDYENPNVVYQPMMCQHCDNAPCENVCPVNATNHSNEGLNQMVYNRCIGTRYCANNCPYKVRRFNWLDYTTADMFYSNEYPINGEEVPFGGDNLTRMVLNPDVTVRSRGVIEKCSFCEQRIQEGKLTAKKEGRRLRDSDVKPACQTACPTEAITFGDTNNEHGDYTREKASPLNYVTLEEIDVRSAILYKARINNRDEEMG